LTQHTIEGISADGGEAFRTDLDGKAIGILVKEQHQDIGL